MTEDDALARFGLPPSGHSKVRELCAYAIVAVSAGHAF
jgi:hypothetical protein